MSNIKNWRDEFAEKIADRINQAVAEARRDEARRCAADVCPECKNPDRWAPAERENERRWIHRWKGRGIPAENHCLATGIHERLHRESQAKSVDK